MGRVGNRTPGLAGMDWVALGAAGVILAAVFAAYFNSFAGPFVYDDLPSITGNRTIRQLWPIGPAFSPPVGGLAVSGRPIVNYSLAINYAISGLDVWSYHAVNLGIHFFAALALFGVARRTLGRALVCGHAWAPAWLALAASLVWALHPLQTESVTYVIQRAESLMGLFYLFTLYCFIRGSEAGAESAARRLWYALSIAACLLGMATKEVMVTAPLIVLLYDRTFLAGSFREALRQRWRIYLCLSGTWLLLAYLMAGTGGRGGTVGFGTSVSWEDYALSQFQAVAHYLRLSIWPHPLVIEYGFWEKRPPPAEVALAGAVIALLAAATAYALWRRPKLGFLGLWFFLILAPSSSIVPIVTEPVAEHRMYLPLAAAAVLAVVALYAALGRLLRQGNSNGALAFACLILCLIPAAVLGRMTAQRNEEYRSALTLWSDAVRKVPDNPGARNNLGDALQQAGRLQDALAQYREAVRMSPSFAGARLNLANALLGAGRVDEALAESEEAVRLRPDSLEIRETLAHSLGEAGRLPEAIVQFEEALRLNPRAAEAHRSLGTVLLRSGRLPEAIAEYGNALRVRPEDPESHAYLAYALAKAGRAAEAVAEYKEALRIRPDLIAARVNLGNAMLADGRLEEALAQFQVAVRLSPGNAEAHNDLGLTLLALGREEEAKAELDTAARLGRKQ
jgi:protein O-mannosyl-transferase